MFIYVFILAVLFFSCHFELSRGNWKQKKILFIIIALFFWFLSFIRWGSGTDWDSYLYFFERFFKFEDFRDEGAFEFLYAALSYFIKLITDDYTIFLFVVACIIFPLTYSTIFKLSHLPIVSLLLFLLLRRADIFFVRESIAIAFCFFSTRYIIDRKLVPFLACVLIGTQFHYSVVIFLPSYWIYSLKIGTKQMLIILGIFSLVAIVLQQVVASYFGNLAGYLGGAFAERTDKYLERGFDTGGASSMSAALIQGTINRLIFFVLYLKARVKLNNDEKFNGYLNFYFVSMILFLLFTPFSLTLGRLVNTYELYSVLLFGYYFHSKKTNKVLLFNIMFSYIALRFVVGTLFGVYSECFVPFKTIFD